MAEHPDIQVVRRGYEAFNAADAEALRELIAADAAHFVPGSGPLAGSHRGIDAILTMYGQLGERSGGTIKVVPELFCTDGQGTVVVTHRLTAERNGKRIDTRESLIFRLHEGRVVALHDTWEDIEAQDAFWSS